MKKKKKKFGGAWRLEEEVPWLTKKSVEFIKKNIDKSHNVLEFGAGASTIFFARNCNQVVSFESGGYSVRRNNVNRSALWYLRLVEKLKKFKITNVELYLLQGYPQSSRVYARVIDSLPDNAFHWALVDGANRNMCIKKSVDKLVSGGYLIIDNYDHIPPKKFINSMEVFMKDEYCLETMKILLSDWKVFKFDEDGWPGLGTIIFQKP